MAPVAKRLVRRVLVVAAPALLASAPTTSAQAPEPSIQRYLDSWAHRAHSLQYDLSAVQRVNARFPHGRWFNRRCDTPRPAACRRGDDWLVPAAAVPARDAAELCRRLDARHAVPRTGYEVQLLRHAMEAADERVVRLGYRIEDGRWTATDARS